MCARACGSLRDCVRDGRTEQALSEHTNIHTHTAHIHFAAAAVGGG